MKYIALLLLISGCATLTPSEKHKADVIKCVQELKATDSSTLDAFTVCSQVYGLKK